MLLIRKFYSNPTSALLIIFFLMVGGLYQFTQLPIALYPNTSKPSVSAHLDIGAMSAEEFKDRYGYDIETVLNSIKDVEQIRSFYSNGSTKYEIDFDWGIEADDAKTDVENALVPFESIFPGSWGRFNVRFDGQFSSRFFVSLKSESMSSKDLTENIKTSLVPSLKSIDGIADVWVVDWKERTLRVEIIPDRLTQFGVTFGEIKEALGEKEYDTSLGRLSLQDAGAFHVTAAKKVTSLAEVKNTVVAHRQGQAIRLRDFAKIELEEKSPDFMFKASGEKTLLIGGYAKPDANIKYVAENFIQLVEARTQEISPDIEAKVLMNPASFINEAVKNIIQAVILGMLIATVVVFLFLRSLRNTVVICVSIPLSLVGGFVLMQILGIELNLISLGAMALAVGMVVDGSIVVLENIVRHLEEAQPQSLQERLDVTIAAVAEVRNAVIASLLTTIIVFAPLPFTSPLASAILGDLAIVMVCVLSVSVIVTLVFIPPLTVFFRSGSVNESHVRGIYRLSIIFNQYVRRLHGYYLGGLIRLLRRRWPQYAFVAAVVAAMAVSAVLVLDVEREVMARPQTDKLFVYVDIQDPSVEIEEREEIVGIFEKNLLKKFDTEFSHTLSQITDSSSWVLLFLRDKSDIEQMKVEVEDFLKNTPFVKFYIDDWTPTSLEIPKPALIRARVTGQTEEERRETLEKISQFFQKQDEVGQTTIRPGIAKDDFLRVYIDNERLARTRASDKYNLNEAKIHEIIAGLLGDETLYEVDMDGETFALKVTLPDNYFTSPLQLENQMIKVGDKTIPLRAVSSIRHERHWAEYYHQDGQTETYVEVMPKQSFAGDRHEFAAELKKELLAEPGLDASRIFFDNTDEEINQNIKSLVVALALAIALIWIVITLQFGSFVQTGIIMTAVPLGFIGVAVSLWVFDSTLSVNSMLGLILLCGTAVNNSILFLDFYNKIREQSPTASAVDHLMATAKLRFRPILITTLTTVLGMIPIAVGWGSGGEILQPLGIAICGGLWISTLLTIYMVPLGVVAVERMTNRLRQVGVLKRLLQTSALFLISCLAVTPPDVAHSQVRVSLDDAVDRTLRTQAELNIAQSEQRRAEYSSRSIYSELLPRVSVGRTYSEQAVRYKDGAPEGRAGRETLKFGQNFFRVEETIPNPYKFQNRVKINYTQEEISESQVVEKRNELIARTRQQYFRAKVAQQSLENAQQNLKAAQQNLDTTRRRYQGGFVHSSDLKRSELSFKGVVAALAESQESFRNELTKLRDLVGGALDADVVLTTPIPKDFAYFTMEEDSIWGMVQAGDPQDIKQLELSRRVEDLRLRNARADFFPDLKLSAIYERKDPEDQGFEFRDPAGPKYLLTAEWEVFSGGASYYEVKANGLRRYEVEESLRQARRDYTEAITRQVNQLMALKRRYEIQQDNVRIALEIVEASRERFRSGTVDSAQVNDDFRDYLRQQTLLLDLSLEIIDATSELARITAEPKLFQQLI